MEERKVEERKRVTPLLRKHLINIRLQLHLLLYSVWVAVVVTVISISFRILLEEKFFFEDNFRSEIIFGFISVVLGVLTALYGLVITNRIAGPIFRLNRHMQDIIDSPTFAAQNRFVFRKQDYFQEVAVTYNKLLDKIKELEKGKNH